MQFGYCVDLTFLLRHEPRGEEIFAGVLAAGYDYIETQLTNLLSLSSVVYSNFKRRLAEANVPCRAGMMIFPYSMPLVGADRNLSAIEEHAKKTLALAAEIGCELLVFGHGGTRRVPEGGSYEVTRGRLIDVLQLLDRLAAPYNLRIAVEPLCDTNMAVSFPEAAALARDCGDRVGGVFDLYHAAALGQSPADITLSPEKLFHLHIACPGSRTVPALTDDQSPYEAFAEAARATGYDGKISVEAGVPEGANIAQAVAEALRITKKYFSQEK